MKISPICAKGYSYKSSHASLKRNANEIKNKPIQNSPSFKSIYVDYVADIGLAKEGMYPARFKPQDSLALNEISYLYPNQDCFICEGFAGRPRLEYRERPMQVQSFERTLAPVYKMEIEYTDKDYPCIPLIIYPNDDLNFIIGTPSYISTNPSLAYTVQAGYEVHKKILEKKYQILDIIGKNEEVDFGGEGLMEKAHRAVKDVEIAVTRYLVECAYLALSDRASARQIYASNFPKIQSRLTQSRRLDLTTSLSKKPDKTTKNSEMLDICAFAIQKYPNMEENLKRIEEVHNYMREVGMTLENSEDLVE